MKKFTKRTISASVAVGLSMFAGGVFAHSSGSTGAGTPTCIESNIMAADAMNGPFSNIPGAGRVLEMNTTTGYRGITVTTPFTGVPALCPGHVKCPGPFKPTGIVSGGENGHAYLTSAVQHALIEHHRDGTAIRTSPVWPTSPSPNGATAGQENFGWVPRLLGNGFMPNGNIAQTTCDANFFNAANSDSMGAGESGITFNAFPGPPVASTNSSYLFFPPVYGTAARADNGRVIVIDQVSLNVIDEYTVPTSGPFANHPGWNCPAGIIFTSDGMYVSMFHGDAVFLIDWKEGLTDETAGVGSNDDSDSFKLDDSDNEAVILSVIDLSDDGTGSGIVNYSDPTFSSGHRRDNLRAIRMSEDGTLFGTRRSRTAECFRGQAPGATAVPHIPGVCNPSVFRQHIFVVDPGSSIRTGTIALDPGVNVIAGVTINRMSGPGCQFVTGVTDLSTVTGDECDVETLYVGVSAGNASCDPNGDGVNGPGHPANQCFKPGGTIYEYRIDKAHQDGGSMAGNGSGKCSGDQADGFGRLPVLADDGNSGCAQPIAQFDFLDGGGNVETLDPRMVMTIHEAFTQ